MTRDQMKTEALLAVPYAQAARELSPPDEDGSIVFTVDDGKELFAVTVLPDGTIGGIKPVM